MKVEERRKYYLELAKKSEDRAWERGCVVLAKVADRYRELGAMEEPPVPW